MALPEIDYGVFRIDVAVDAGPFGGPLTGTREVTLRR